MTTFRFRCVALVSLTALTACNRQDDRVCMPPDKIPIGEIARARDSVEWSKIAKNCVHAWAYRLASAPGSNSEIARAAVTACDDPVHEWITWRSIGKDSEVPQYGSPEALEQSAKSDVLELALFRVVQARAGKCDVPETTTDYSEIDNPVANAGKK